MEARELRIGNLVRYRDKKDVEVSNLGNSFETVDLVNGLAYGSDDIREYNPIPLTEEFILKAECNGCKFTKVRDEFSIWIDDIECLFVFEYSNYTERYHFTGGEGVRFGIGFNYLHEFCM